MGKKFFFAAAGGSQSNKPANFANEDRFDVSRLFFNETSNVGTENDEQGSPGLFIGLYDGHGGANAAEFLKNNLRTNFLADLKSCGGSDVLQSLKRSFQTTDAHLYKELLKSRAQADQKENICRCRFFQENPCRCMKASIYAREGTTGTAVVIKDKNVFVANVGDSEAVMFTFQKMMNVKFMTDAYIDSEIRRKRSRVTEEDVEMEAGTSTAASESEDSSAPGVPRELVERIAEDRLKKANKLGENRAVKMTEVHTPDPVDGNEDYERIKEVLASNSQLYLERGIDVEMYGDGIKRGPTKRLNYVRVPGCHCLNMTRSFGDFGLKSFIESSERHVLDPQNSTVVSTPSLNQFSLKGPNQNCFLVVGSDGLWDNLSKSDVQKLTLTFVRSNIIKFWKQVNLMEKYANSPESVRSEVLLGSLAFHVSKMLQAKAMTAGKKMDDISVVVVFFSPILKLFL